MRNPARTSGRTGGLLRYWTICIGSGFEVEPVSPLDEVTETGPGQMVDDSGHALRRPSLLLGRSLGVAKHQKANTGEDEIDAEEETQNPKGGGR